MDVSKNSGFSPQIIHFNRVFHCKPSILGYHYFWKHLYGFVAKQIDFSEKHWGDDLKNVGLNTKMMV